MKISVSMMCADYGRLAEQFEVLNQFADAYHWDMVDGHYAQSLSLNLDMISSLREVIKKPIHAHLAVERPQDFVPQLIDLGVEEICFHLDTVNAQFFRLANLIKDAGLGVGVVLTPVERPEILEYVLEALDSVNVLTVDPGFAGQRFIGAAVRKIPILKEWKEKYGYTYEIEVDGGVNERTFQQLVEAGAERFVLGSSGLFSLAATLEEAVEKARGYIPFKANPAG